MLRKPAPDTFRSIGELAEKIVDDVARRHVEGARHEPADHGALAPARRASEAEAARP